MKVVKLNRRFKRFREHGHTVALRFASWSKEAGKCEEVCREKLGYGWRTGQWESYFGERSSRSSSRPYWISFRNEADATLVLLSVDLTK